MSRETTESVGCFENHIDNTVALESKALKRLEFLQIVYSFEKKLPVGR